MAKAKGDTIVSDGEGVEMQSVSSMTPVLPTFAEIYGKLAAPFDKTYQRQIPGGRSMTYITTEQAISRLTEVLGPNWDWNVDAMEVEGDDVIVNGTLSATFVTGDFDVVHTSRSGIGGARVKRNRDGNVQDLGNDMKAAESSALKRAASRFGVGLYLYEKGEGGENELPQNYSAPSTPRPAVQFNGGGSGNSTTGVITRKSANGVVLDGNGTWFNASKFAPIDLNPFQVGQRVTISHAPGKTFIDGISLAGEAQVAEEQDAF